MNAKAQRKAIASLLCGMAAAILMLAGCAQSSTGQGEPVSESASSQVEMSSDAGGGAGGASDLDGEDASGENGANGETDPAQQSPEGPAMQAFDIANGANRAAVNERLSWMAQTFCYSSGRIDLKDANVQTDFALPYIGITNRDAFESGEFEINGVRGGGAGGMLNKRVAIDVVADVVLEYLGEHYDATKLEEPFASDGRFVYCGVTAPYGQTAAYSSAKSLEDLGNGRYKAPFEIFIDYMPYGQKGETFFQLEPKAMMAELGMTKPSASGEAVIRVTEDGDAPHVVVEEYFIGNAGAMDATGAYDAEASGAASSASSPSATSGANKKSLTARFTSIKKRKASDERMGGSTTDMIEAGSEYISEYETLIDKLLDCVKALPKTDKDALQAEQDAWSEEVEEKAQKAADQAAGGSASGLNRLEVKMSMQEKRIEALLDMLP